MSEATNQTAPTSSSNLGWMKGSESSGANAPAGATTQDTAAPAAPVNTPAAKQEAKSDEKTNTDWRSSLPEDIRADPSLAVIGDIPSLAKSFINAQKMIGRNKISVPDPKLSTDEDWAGVYKALGLPEKLDEYKVDVKEDAGLDPDFITHFKENAHKAGVLPKQAQKLIDWYSEASKGYAANLQKGFEDKKAEHFNTLKKEWGAAYPKHEEAAALTVRDFATPEDLEYMNERQMTSDPVLLKIFSKIGLTYKEDQVQAAQSRAGKDVMTPADAQMKSSTILSDASHPYNLKGHPKHAEAVEEMKKLFGYMYPKQEK